VNRSTSDQRSKAERFRELHTSPEILVLPNAWDVASARMLEVVPACRAIGTSSAGIAAILGYVDREGIGRDEMLGMVERIASAVDVPVTADIEDGYGPTAADAAETARGVIAAGAVGLNLEDGLVGEVPALASVSLQVDKITATREAAAAAGVPLVVNARTDAFWLGVGDADAQLEETLLRARAYLAAGADCIFVPGAVDAATVRTLTTGISGPVNVLASPGSPPVRELESLGVSRVSVGSALMRAAVGHLERMATEYLVHGTYGSLSEGAIPYAELARLLARR
jgi:2-methylisocitrate lyase-like PEP mutase family enzyme